MDVTRARILSQEITDGVKILGGSASWEHVDPAALRGWASELLARLVAAIGDAESIRYISGWVEEDPVVSGSIAVFTESRLIRAFFTAPPEGHQRFLDATVNVVSRGRVLSLVVLSAGHLPSLEAEVWPSRARVSITIEGEDEALVLPLRRESPIGDAPTANYLPEFL